MLMFNVLHKLPVTHRIGGLENCLMSVADAVIVTHRIGGLEKIPNRNIRQKRKLHTA